MSKIKFKSFFGLVLCTFILLSFSVIFAVDEIPEVLIDVTKDGIVTTESVGGIKIGEDILTIGENAIRDGMEMFTTNSKDYDGGTGVEAGGTITGNLGFVPYYLDENAEKQRVESIEMGVVFFKNISNEQLAEKIINSCGSSMNVEELLNGMTSDNYLSPFFGEYGVVESKIKVLFYEDGTYSIEIPEDLGDGLYAFVNATHLVTNEKVVFDKLDRKFIEIGDGQANQKPDDEDNDNLNDVNKDNGNAYCGISTSTKNYTHLKGEASGTISNSKYDVTTAIPTSESLLFSVLNVDDSLYDIQERNRQPYAGVRDINITATAVYWLPYCTHAIYGWRTYCDMEYDSLTGDYYYTNCEERWVVIDYMHNYSNPKCSTASVSKTYEPFSYEARKSFYDVPKSNIYPVLNAIVSGAPTLEDVFVGLSGGPVVSAQVLDVYAELPVPCYSLSGGTYENYAEAEAALDSIYESAKSVNIARCNAAIGCRGSVNYSYRDLNVTTTSSNGVMPKIVKTSGSKTELIPEDKLNGNYSTSGDVIYSGGFVTSFDPNDVFVHTPVVNVTSITTGEFINQKINKTEGTTYLMLDEEFTVIISDYGTHNNYKGYGNRMYNSYQAVPGKVTNWGKIKDVKLPFDAYLHTVNGKVFIPANTWLSSKGYASAHNGYTFTVPVWVKEGTHVIETRVIAENAQDYGLVQWGANYDSSKYVAGMETQVEVIGKIYNLRVSGTNDPAWSILSEKTGNKYITAEEFPFGQDGQNTNTKYNYAPKLGYTFVFDFKTKGTKSNNIDVNIEEEGFYFVSKNGGEAVPVDLYYHTTTNKYVKIGSSNDVVDLKVNLKNSFMKVAAQELIDSVRIKQGQYNYSQDVYVGSFSKMNLPENLRLCYNNLLEYASDLNGDKLYGNSKATIISNATSEDRIIESVGHWYAGYRLPASTRAVSKEQTISEAIANNSFLSGGYILVKFNIVTRYKNSVGDWEYLEYMGPEALNESGSLVVDWTKGGTQEITLPNGKSATVPVGTIAIYETDLRSSNDVETSGTH